MKQAVIQKHLAALLDTALGEQGWASVAFAFRPLAEHELRVADAAWVSQARFLEIDMDDYLMGSPEIVVEVLSPSNRASELVEKKQLCFATGCQEFWIVDPKRQVVEITSLAGPTRFYGMGDRIPVGATAIAVDAIFQ